MQIQKNSPTPWETVARVIAFLLAGLLLFTACSAFASTPDWQLFTSKLGNFSVMMPAKPDESTADVDTPLGRSLSRADSAQTSKGYYSAMFVDYPPDAFATADINDMLNAVRDQAVKNSGGTLISSQLVKLGDNPGITLVIDAPDKDLVTQLTAYFVKNRRYQLITVFKKADYSEDAVKQFTDTFKLLPKTQTS